MISVDPAPDAAPGWARAADGGGQRSHARDASDDRTDLAACAVGDQDAFERVYVRHVGACLALARRILRDEHLAQDAVQEAFLQFWNGAADIDPDRSSVGAWLTLLTRRRAIDRVRKESRQPLPVAVLPEVIGATDAEASADSRLLSAQMVDSLRRAPDEPRRCLVLAYWGGYTMTEIAQITGAPVGTVKTRLRRALQLLRKEVLEGTSGSPLFALDAAPSRLSL